MSINLKISVMEEIKTEVVEMTHEEKQQYAAFLAAKKLKEQQDKAKEDREAYAILVDETVDRNIANLMSVSESLRDVKQQTLEDFKAVIEMKAQVIPRKRDKETEQRSHQFTNSSGERRITVGTYTMDDYRDTVEDGLAIVTECIDELAKDDTSKALVKMVKKLLARDAKGTLKASRVIQLRKVAEDINHARLLEGVKIIEEAYQPATSKQYVKAEYKNSIGAWVPIPLGMTEA